MGGSGSSQNPGEDLSSTSPSPPDPSLADRFHVLVVEDNEADLFLIREAIRAARLPLTLKIIEDGEGAMRFFDRADMDPAIPCPALVILDINLPKRTGGEVLKHMRQTRRCANALVVAVSSSNSDRDREQMTRFGANSYFHKPSQFDEFMELGELIKRMLRHDTPSS